MAVDTKYGSVTVERTSGNPLGDDEPVFLIRGRDKAAVEAIKAYADIAAQFGAPTELVESCRRRAGEMLGWQMANHDLVKVPD